VPVGAGLSSSAALECAVGAAVSDLEGLGLLADEAGRTALAAACQRAENEIAGAPTGGMDQLASMLGRPGHAVLLDCRDGSTRAVPFDLGAHGQTLLVVDTRAPHALVDGQYAARRRSCHEAAALLDVATLRDIPVDGLDQALARLADPTAPARVTHVVTEIARVSAFVEALEAGELDRAGTLMTASHGSLRDDYEVSCPELDLAVTTATESGALGARMTGGGFGGCAIALVPQREAARVAAEVEAAFAGAGFTRPVAFTVTAGGGAERVR